uniref:Radical SAM superfamily enzyme YgiQ, UPF0313 family n=1 Tax=Candidatus Kentrum sp. MB TaxID=2138164 RepID=A0A450X1Z3_9GAMM|nr:MAG: Radical SAM superfamily enzyme YgiQ, UPF0313 family [Candidatus Kentron sp. MB]VFK28451.1 MAG: Radical SAM superfamily enzyme YgiQ, UPF0313 family [Candidatus Kentron sp. MB]VFK74259.1 MAG: Radical SAM superfamily enzyme YgiQ, UPF0313 family [Candidatus Kentron sp. MB]
MNILLIQPEGLPGAKESRSTIPLSLLYLAAIIRDHGYTPHILDFSVLDVPEAGKARTAFLEETCNNKIKEIGTKLVGINCFTTMHFHLVDELAELIKRNNPTIKICLGGAHPTFFGQDIISNREYVDYIIAGEGEEAIVELAKVIEKGHTANKSDLGKIPGLIYRDENGEILKNDRESYIKDIGILKRPAWELVNLTDYYGNYQAYYNPKGMDFQLAVPIITTRSCPFKCSFCSAHLIMGRNYRKRTVPQIVDEIEYLHIERGQNYFSFMDDIINIDKKHVIGISNEICRRNINIQLSINQGLYLSMVEKEMIDALADAGLVTVCLPIEHGDEDIRMSILKKRLKNEKIYEVVEYVKSRDIFSIGLFIMGFPEETEETLEKTRKLIIDLSLDVNAVSTLVPFPKTAVHEQAKKDGLLLIEMEQVWKGYDYFDPQNKDRFFIQPYNVSLSTLKKYRDIFDSMYYYSERAKLINNIGIS